MKLRKYLPFIVLIIVALVVIFLWLKDSNRLKNYAENPRVGDIYIFQEDNVYAPVRIDKMENDQIWMLNYQYFFSEAVPDREQILDDEFDLNNHLIYEREELRRMFEQGRVAEIYRDE